jgi:SAM-dependent methyltransferase
MLLTMSASRDYLLGVGEDELERLRFQHEVWRPVTGAFLDRVGVRRGATCLDVGAGPGFVSIDLCEKVGPSGEVTALEPSPLFVNHLESRAKADGRTNLKCLLGKVEDLTLPRGAFDLVFVRWVIAFVADVEGFLAKLVPSLRPGGVLAIQDYYYEGLSLYPRGGAFDGAADAVRAYYRSVGGDPYVTGRLPTLFKRFGMELIDYSPHSMAGGPGSNVMEWGHRFFSRHFLSMVEKKILAPKVGEAMLADWMSHRDNPDALFFSPLVVDVAGRLAAG